jgi:autotransporter-associated beta strand protein
VLLLNNTGNTQPSTVIQGLSYNGGFTELFRVSFRADGNLGQAGGAVTLANASLNYAPTAAGTLTINRPLFLSSQGGALTVGAASGQGDTTDPSPATPGSVLTWSGVVANRGTESGSLIVQGPGTLILTAANTYSGGTTVVGSTSTVQAGTLRVTNTTGSGTGTGRVTVAAGATLSGTGFIVPNIGSQATNTVTISGTVSPGNSTLTFGSAADLASVVLGGTYLAAIGTGTSSDLLAINGSLTLLSGSTLTVQGTASGSSYTLATYQSRVGTFTNMNLPTGYQVIYNSTSILLAPVPEPAGILLMCAAGAGLAGLIRYRRRTRVVA